MTHIHFILETIEIQNLINQSIYLLHSYYINIDVILGDGYVNNLITNFILLSLGTILNSLIFSLVKKKSILKITSSILF